jgi:hypothetical protein
MDVEIIAVGPYKHCGQPIVANEYPSVAEGRIILFAAIKARPPSIMGRSASIQGGFSSEELILRVLMRRPYMMARRFCFNVFALLFALLCR